MNRVLTLNGSYFPLALVNWERAVCLLFQNKAEVVEDSDRTISSPSKTMKVPTIIRMRSKKFPQSRRVRLSRKNVLLRDDHTCQYCSQKKAKHLLNLDHILPKSQGGQTRWTNIVTACIECNSRKGGRTPEQAGMKLLRDPQPPNWSLAQEIAHHFKEIPQAWEPYLGSFLRHHK